MDAVNEVVRDLDGSFSAEHGIGRLKPYMMPDWRGGAELDLMRRIKAALDPGGLHEPRQGAALTGLLPGADAISNAAADPASALTHQHPDFRSKISRFGLSIETPIARLSCGQTYFVQRVVPLHFSRPDSKRRC